MFRRDRLELVDQGLRDVRPDVLVLQDVMARSGDSAESDQRILMAGSLADYDWHEERIAEHKDTRESQALVLALTVPYRFELASPEIANHWSIGDDGYLAAATFDYEGQPVDVFNVQMPSHPDPSYVDYAFIEEIVLQRLKALHHCPKRFILAGYIPGDENAKQFGKFLAALQLKDVSNGYCQVASTCFTATPANDIFMATVGDEAPARTDRILVHTGSLVYSSGRDFEANDPSNRYARSFGISRLWPTQRFGWASQVRLARCTAAEIDETLQLVPVPSAAGGS